jgi:hypothetical protein
LATWWLGKKMSEILFRLVILSDLGLQQIGVKFSTPTQEEVAVIIALPIVLSHKPRSYLLLDFDDHTPSRLAFGHGDIAHDNAWLKRDPRHSV